MPVVRYAHLLDDRCQWSMNHVTRGWNLGYNAERCKTIDLQNRPLTLAALSLDEPGRETEHRTRWHASRAAELEQGSHLSVVPIQLVPQTRRTRKTPSIIPGENDPAHTVASCLDHVTHRDDAPFRDRECLARLWYPIERHRHLDRPFTTNHHDDPERAYRSAR